MRCIKSFYNNVMLIITCAILLIYFIFRLIPNNYNGPLNN